MTAYNRHRRNGEEPDEACRAAKTADKQKRRERAGVEQAAAASERLESMEPESDRLAALRETRDILRAHQMDCPPSAVAGIAKEYKATLAQIAELEAEVKKPASGAPAPSPSESSAGGGLNDIARKREERQRRRAGG